jgi:hypothetical protein
MVLETIDKTRQYLDDLEEHYNNVQKAWSIIKLKCADMYFITTAKYLENLEYEISRHDMSKIGVKEFVQCRIQFYRASTDQLRPLQTTNALTHHIDNNDHHWENWTHIHADMTIWEVCCVHMLADWLAKGMSEKPDDPVGYLIEHYESVKGEAKFKENQTVLIEEIIDRLSTN